MRFLEIPLAIVSIHVPRARVYPVSNGHGRISSVSVNAYPKRSTNHINEALTEWSQH